jgi:hypothetical protein
VTVSAVMPATPGHGRIAVIGLSGLLRAYICGVWGLTGPDRRMAGALIAPPHAALRQNVAS